ncbi:MAG: ATP-grasp domain-containing protein [Chloroflexi bacterium]|nr:ATP-grasp domain-containing protein [Chloroflexota bacterium]
MAAINVLFTSVGRRVELVRLFRQAYETLGLDGTLVGVDIDPLAPAINDVDTFYLVPRINQPDYIPTLQKICKTESIDLIFPLIDPEIPILAQNRTPLEAPGAKLVVIPQRGVGIVNDKWETYQFFQNLGVNTPQSWIELDAIPQDFPLFVKPRAGSAAKYTFNVNNQRELQFFFDYVPQPIVQEYLPGPEITCDVLCDLEGKVFAIIQRQRIEVRSGEVVKGVTVHYPEVQKACVKIAQGLAAIGPITIQCMMKDGIPHFTEINPRFGGGLPFAVRAGVHAPLWLLSRLTDNSIEIPPLGTYETGLYMTRFDDTYFITPDVYEARQRARI